MKTRVKLAAPMAGDHGNFPADSIVPLPDHVARQVVLNGHGTLVDDQGGAIPHDFEPDAPAKPPAPAGEAAAEAPASKAKGKKGGKAAKPAEDAKPEAAEADEGDLSEWSQE